MDYYVHADKWQAYGIVGEKWKGGLRSGRGVIMVGKAETGRLMRGEGGYWDGWRVRRGSALLLGSVAGGFDRGGVWWAAASRYAHHSRFHRGLGRASARLGTGVTSSHHPCPKPVLLALRSGREGFFRKITAVYCHGLPLSVGDGSSSTHLLGIRYQQQRATIQLPVSEPVNPRAKTSCFGPLGRPRKVRGNPTKQGMQPSFKARSRVMPNLVP